MADHQGAPGDVLDPVGDDLDQPRFFGPGHHDEEHHEKDQGRPLDLFFQHLHDIHPADDQQDRCPDQGGDARLHVQGPVDDEQEDGDPQHDPAIDQQLVVGDLVFLPQVGDHLRHVPHLGLQIVLFIPVEEIDDGHYQADQTDDGQVLTKSTKLSLA